jgi:hypothetical protein
MLKISYTTIVNMDFEPYLQQLIKSHQMFSRIDLTVYTINFEIKNDKYSNVNFVPFIDENLQEFDETGKNRFIRNKYEKHKYTTLLKSKVLKKFSDLYDYYFFIDADGLLTKNSDTLVINSINEFGFSKFPVSVKYFYQYSTTHKYKESVFDDSGDFNPRSLGYYPLIELYNTDFSQIDYLTTYCVYYTRECIDFLDEVEKICFDPDVIKDYDRYLPLGDETVFNYLYSKYNFSKFISSYLCFDMNPGVEMAVVQNNLRLLNNFISFIHTKRYVPNLQEDKKFNDLKTEDYDCIFEFLQEKEELGSRINVTSFDRGPELDIINFNLDGGDYNSNFNLKIVSLFRPNEECPFNMDLYENVNFFVGKKSDVWIKDLYLLITYFSGYSNIIKDCVKIN